MSPFPFWGSQQVFQLVNATQSTISRSLVAVLGQINAVQVILFYRMSIKSFPDYKCYCKKTTWNTNIFF